MRSASAVPENTDPPGRSRENQLRDSKALAVFCNHRRNAAHMTSMANKRVRRFRKKPRSLDDLATAPYPIGLTPWVDDEDETAIRSDLPPRAAPPIGH